MCDNIQNISKLLRYFVETYEKTNTWMQAISQKMTKDPTYSQVDLRNI